MQFLLWIALAGFLLILPTRAGASEEKQKKVLVIYSVRKEAPTPVVTERVFQKDLNEGLAGRLDYYAEFFDVTRFPDPEYQMALRDFLKRKYQGQKFDLIIAATGTSLQFVAHYGDELFPETPVIFAGISRRRIEELRLGPRFTGFSESINMSGSLDLALRLQPGIKHMFVVGGASEWDKFYEDAARQQFQRYENRVEISYLTGLPLNDLIERVANLPERSIIYYLTLTQDGAGNRYLPGDPLGKLSAVANAPIYSWFDQFLDYGIFGGDLLSPEVIGHQITALALRILRGEKPETIPISEPNLNIKMVNWRQLQRWGISEDRLPPDVVIRFRDPTFWQQYKWRIGFAISLIAIQFLVIALLIEHARRQRATKTLDKAQAELAHVSRVMTMGELVSSVAHEVNQPLTAIRTYGDASLRFLTGESPNLEKSREAIEKIILNSARASEVIKRIRALVKKSDTEKALLNINEVIQDVVELTQRERGTRQVQLQLELEPGLPHLEGDRIQLQQVMLNLILNGIEAMNAVNGRAKKLQIKTQADEPGMVLVTVRDSGVGLNSDDLNRIFDAFYSTKPEGMGMGLSISRTIIEKHGGRLWATSNGGGGAAFHFTLPV